MIAAALYIFSTTLAVLISGYALFSYLKQYRLYKAVAKFPGPPTLPFIGNAHCFMGSTHDIFENVMHQMDLYSSPYRIWLGSKLLYMIYEPEQIKTALLSPKTMNRAKVFDILAPWLGTGLFTAPAAKWKIHRKLIAPSFHQRILDSSVEIFATKSEIMVKEMEIEANGKAFEIMQYISLCALDTIGETAMGVPSNDQTQRHSDYIEAATKTMKAMSNRIFKLWMHPDYIFYSTRTGKNLQKSIKYLHERTYNILRQKKEALSRNEIHQNKNCVTLSSNGERKAFLDLLIKLSDEGNVLTDEELREEVETMFITGQETTAAMNCFVILMLASYPEIQTKVFEELCEIYGSKDSREKPVRSEDLHRMEYLERVIKETMRLFPVGALLLRHVSEDLDIGGYTLTGGSTVGIGILKMHRDEKYWQDPMTFNPDRFLPEEWEKRLPYTYIPFGAGPRNCIAVKYAMMSMKTLIATVLRKYVIKKDNILPIQDIKLKVDILLKPEESIMIRIENRIYGKDVPD